MVLLASSNKVIMGLGFRIEQFGGDLGTIQLKPMLTSKVGYHIIWFNPTRHPSPQSQGLISCGQSMFIRLWQHLLIQLLCVEFVRLIQLVISKCKMEVIGYNQKRIRNQKCGSYMRKSSSLKPEPDAALPKVGQLNL